MREWAVTRTEDVAPPVRTSHCGANAANLRMALIRGQARSACNVTSVRISATDPNTTPGESCDSRPILALNAQRMLSQRGGSEMPGKNRTLNGRPSAIGRK